MGFFPDLDLLNYLSSLDNGINQYLEYFYTASIVISLLTGVSGIYKAKLDRLNLVRGIFLLSVFFWILGQGRAFSYITLPIGTLLKNEHRIFYSYFFGFAICASLSSTFYVMNVVGWLRDPLRYSLWAFFSFPTILILSSFMENLHSLIYLGKTLIFLLQIVSGVWIFSYIRKNRMKRIYYNYPIQNFAVALAIISHTIGLWTGISNLILISVAVPGFFVIYFFILEYNFPDFWKKNHLSDLSNGLKLESDSEFEKQEAQSLNPTNSRNLIEGLDVDIIDAKINRFVLNREFLDEEIRLPDFSAYVGLSVHQASYYLNQYKKLSFSDFLNYHRLETAKEMIVMNQNMNLLEIALACGFNSPSSFRRACIKFEEKSPKELRQRLIQIERPIQNLELQAQV
ncbi:AraC family transcriptional regulator [Leptospira tipperaryensis]|uniref:AraC family transcriptional regulator n=1 Tax=Leptospira tipperaryensis TaxID=2564040 RepID=A0A1D7UU55_9LEPT|nr:helix-turn-helix domain-containing protein [Leptospira tipperaryensis]AOP33152.1 AraC family transcriptional regulator [Leptospira tipperaryensis]